MASTIEILFFIFVLISIYFFTEHNNEKFTKESAKRREYKKNKLIKCNNCERLHLISEKCFYCFIKCKDCEKHFLRKKFNNCPICFKISYCEKCDSTFPSSINCPNCNQKNYKKKNDVNNITIKNEKYYGSILELNGKVTPSKIKSQYKKKMKEYHPDNVTKLGSKIQKIAEDESKIINEAYEYFRVKYKIR